MASISKLILFGLLLLLVSAARADWTIKDTQREMLFVVPAVIDWGQTRYIAEHPENFYEAMNGYLGPHPSVRQVDHYFPRYLARHLVISWAIRGEVRPWWQYATSIYEIGLVGRNYRLGIGVNF